MTTPTQPVPPQVPGQQPNPEYSAPPELQTHHEPKGVTITGIIGLVLSVIALLTSFIPIINNVSIILAAIALVLAIIGLVGTVRGKKTGNAIAIIAAVASVLALVISFAMQSAAEKAIDDAFEGGSSEQQQDSSEQEDSDSNNETDKETAEAQVELQATATDKGTVIWGEAGSSNTEEFTGSWSKTLTGQEAEKDYTITVSGDFMGDENQEVSCTVLVNGEEKSHKTGSGTAGSAMCDTYGLF